MESVTTKIKLRPAAYQIISEESKKLGTTVEKLLAKFIDEFAQRVKTQSIADQKKRALQNILSLNLPVSDWEKMEQEVEEAHSPCGIEGEIL